MEISELLRYQPPYDWPAMIDFLVVRAIPGIEVVEVDRYRRTFEMRGLPGMIEVRHQPDQAALVATVRFPEAGALAAIVPRIRRVFDLDCDIELVNRQLSKDPPMATLVTARPGLRVPGAWDGFEIAVRAILGQQITVSAARGLAAKLVARYGAAVTRDRGESVSGLNKLFPRSAVIAAADLTELGMPRARARSLSALAAAVTRQPALLERGPDLETAVSGLRTLPGIGEWTAQYIAMRGLREPDAFPAADIGLLRAMSGADGRRPSAAALLERADAWRPWRAYAAQHLWVAERPR